MLTHCRDGAPPSSDTSATMQQPARSTSPQHTQNQAPPGPSGSARRSDLVEGLETLVAAALAGRPGAMGELVARFTPLVRSVVRRAGIFGAEAEDIEQEAWLRLTTNLDRVREPAALPRWLSVTTGRLCSNLFDKRRRVQPAGDFSEDQWPSPERLADPADFVCLRDEMVRLHAAIDTLNTRDRVLIRMLMDSAPYREISATISMPVGSIGPTRERVLRKLANNVDLRNRAPRDAARGLTPAA